MVLNKGIYTLKKRTKDSDETSTSQSRDNLSEVSLTFYDNQPPVGKIDLSYVKRSRRKTWEELVAGAEAYAERFNLKPPEVV